MNESTELALVPPAETALQVFQVVGGLDPWLSKIRAEVDKFQAALPGLSTVKDRALYASMAHKIARSKTALSAVGKSLSAAQKEVPKKIDAERKRVWELLEVWQKEVRQPLDDWQAAEDARVDRHQTVIDFLLLRDREGSYLTAESIRAAIAAVEAVAIGEHLEEFEAEAARAKDKTLNDLRAALATREKHEAELAEIAQFNAEKTAHEQREREELFARQAVEKANRDAEARAQAERDAAARREQALIDQATEVKRQADQDKRDADASAERHRLQLQLHAEQAERQKEQAERDRIAAEHRAEHERQAAIGRQARAVEQARLDGISRQQEQAAEVERQAKAREADVAHKTKINRAALEAFIAEGMPAECAKQAVTLIAQRKIPSVTIAY